MSSEANGLAIRVVGLGKRYALGESGPTYQTARENLTRAATSWFRRAGAVTHDLAAAVAERRALWALKDVSFEVPRGEVVGIIGRNGAGKSTCLKILARITTPSEGYVDIAGRVGSLLEVGTGFHAELTGRENIFLNGAILGMKRAELARRLDEIVAFAEIERFLDTPVKHYSSGMYMRLAFAVAAHLEHEILLVDEVLAVGDLAFQKKCLERMDQVRRGGRTVVFVSHNLAAATSLCSKGILLDQGRVVATGDIGDVVQTYISVDRRLAGSRRWDDPADAPGNDVVRLMSVRILSEDTVTADVRIDRDIWIELVFINYKANAHMAASIHLVDQMRSPVLASLNMPSACLNHDEWAGRPYPVGVFTASCKIPANFLNEGQYSVNALVMTDHQRIQLQAKDAVTFTVHETGEMRKEYTGHWIGAVRPKLEWHTEYRPDGSARGIDG